jgi:hypothetical protein
MQVTVSKEESQFLRVNPAAGARAPTTGVNPWQRPNTTNRSACSGSRSAPGLISRPSSLPYRPSSRTDCGHPAVHAGGATKLAQVTRGILSEVTDSLHPARPSGDTFLVFSLRMQPREPGMSRLFLVLAFLAAAASSASAKPLHETESCPEGQFYCAFISKCISSNLKCPATKATSARSYQKTTKPY